MHKKILLTAVNAKYIHSNLAIRYLKKYCENQIKGIDITEFSINDNINNILKKLYRSNSDIYGFSCYIWNISLIRSICSSLKKAKPKAVIIVGGPEVSYDPASLLENNPFIDYVVVGEGEETLLDLLNCIKSDRYNLSDIPGIAYREETTVVITQARSQIASLDAIPFPYDNFNEFENKIIYYETSRGCPFNCQYCLSSTIHGVRYLSMDRLRKDIKNFVEAGIKQVKLVDRTFNCDISRSIEIMQYITEQNAPTNFHFEIAADLINEHFLKTVEKAPEGMFQFEIGVQSTNPKTLSEIKRTMNFDKVRINVERLVALKNSHIHLDLIAGLPYEDMKSFASSFNDVYTLKPDMLQLGFLKLLKGSNMRERISEYGMEHHDFPPYEVIKTKWLSYDELIVLKDLEHIFEQYYNSGRFKNSLDFLIPILAVDPFSFYYSFSEYWSSKEYYNSSKSINELYEILKNFIIDLYMDKLNADILNLFNEYMKLDWVLYSKSGSIPPIIERFDHTTLKEKLQGYLKDNVTEMEGFEAFKNMSMREVLKHVGYEVFLHNIFSDNSSNDKIVMFFPLKQNQNMKKPFFITVPLSDITNMI
jgi:radical SAM superfamily enzyme YgiQ (UPF0313 family)